MIQIASRDTAPAPVCLASAMKADPVMDISILDLKHV